MCGAEEHECCRHGDQRPYVYRTDSLWGRRVREYGNTANSDRSCTVLTECGADEFDPAPTATSDRVCQTTGACGADEYESTRLPTVVTVFAAL